MRLFRPRAEQYGDNYYTGEVDIYSGASMKDVPNILWLGRYGKEDIISVGGKGASLGEMASIGLPVPKAFVVTAQAFRRFLVETGLEGKIFASYSKLDVEDNEALEKAAEGAKAMVLKAKMPAAIRDEIKKAYKKISSDELIVAVRSSATAEDLPDASFAGQQETYLNIRGEAALLTAVQKCWASLYRCPAIYLPGQAGVRRPHREYRRGRPAAGPFREGRRDVHVSPDHRGAQDHYRRLVGSGEAVVPARSRPTTMFLTSGPRKSSTASSPTRKSRSSPMAITAQRSWILPVHARTHRCSRTRK